MNIASICKRGLPALGLAALLGGLPNGAWAQNSAAPVPGAVTTESEAMRLFKLPLQNATPAFIVGKLSRVYYFGARPAGPGISGFGANSASNGGFGGGGFGGGGNPFGGASQAATILRLDPSPLRLDGVRFLIDNERDNSLLIEATPEGFNALRGIVSALDVPVTARARHLTVKLAR